MTVEKECVQVAECFKVLECEWLVLVLVALHSQCFKVLECERLWNVVCFQMVASANFHLKHTICPRHLNTQRDSRVSLSRASRSQNTPRILGFSNISPFTFWLRAKIQSEVWVSALGNHLLPILHRIVHFAHLLWLNSHRKLTSIAAVQVVCTN